MPTAVEIQRAAQLLSERAPMPAKITRDQALHFAPALLRGQPEGGRIALTLFRDRIVEIQRA